MIPAEAVEAAAKAIFGVDDATWDLQIQDVRDSYLEDAKNALEAAAPHIRAQALEDAAAEIDGNRLLPEPFHFYYPKRLRARAAVERPTNV